MSIVGDRVDRLIGTGGLSNPVLSQAHDTFPAHVATPMIWAPTPPTEAGGAIYSEGPK